jgi:hypothetical protein
VRAVFKWQANGPDDNPPQVGTLYVKVSAYTNVPASITYGNPAGTLSGLVVNNGFGAPITNSNYGTQYNYTSQGKHLVQVKLNGQTEIAIPYVTMHGAVTISGTTGNTSGSTASVGAYLSYSAEKTDKGLKLTRAGARNEVFSIDAEGNSVTTSDTRWSYTERTDNSIGQMVNFQDNPVWVTQVIGATPIGTWSPYTSLTGVWSPFNFSDTAPPYYENAVHFQHMPNGGSLLNEAGMDYFPGSSNIVSVPQGWYYVPSSNPNFADKKVTVAYTLTDNVDGAVAKAKYVLNLHDKYERKTHQTARRNINVRPAPNGLWVTQTRPGDDLTVYLETAETWEVSVSVSGEVGSSMAGALGINLGFSRSVTFNTGAQVTCHNVPLGYSVRPEIYDAVIVHSGLADEYDNFGRAGEVPYEIIEPDTPAGGMQASLPVWRGDGDPPPPPGGGG